MKIRKEISISMTFTAVDFISTFRGEHANEYATHLNYVEMGAWEKDYFAWWINTCDIYGENYPTLSEIIDFATKLNDSIEIWLNGVEAGVIDSEAGWEV